MARAFPRPQPRPHLPTACGVPPPGTLTCLWNINALTWERLHILQSPHLQETLLPQELEGVALLAQVGTHPGALHDALAGTALLCLSYCFSWQVPKAQG